MSTDPAEVPQAQAGSSRVLRPKRVEDYDPQRLGLPKPPGFIRTFFRRNPWIIDAVLMGFFYYTAIGAIVGSTSSSTWPMTATITSAVAVSLVSLAITGAILFRRFVPRLLAGLCCVLFLVGVPTNIGALGGFGLVIALYALGVYRSARAAWLWTVIGSVAGTAGALLGGLVPFPVFFVVLFGYGSVFVIASLVGISVGNRARYMDALLARAAQLARERDQQAQLATASERARIAREMHDIVAHSLTVMIALADGATRAADSSPERAKDAMAHVSEIGRTSLTDMRRVLGVLTEASGDEVATGSDTAALAPLAPQPTFDELRPLVDSYRAAGLPITLTVSGVVPDESAIQLTVFRVVQESLTNALRYARAPSRIEVAVDFTSPGAALVTVSDDGLGATPGEVTPSLGSGRGLIGMRERVALYGGTVVAGSQQPRGWRVQATIPVTTSDPATTAIPTTTEDPETRSIPQ